MVWMPVILLPLAFLPRDERTWIWLKQWRRLTVRYEVRDDIHFAFLQLACCLILCRRLS